MEPIETEDYSINVSDISGQWELTFHKRNSNRLLKTVVLEGSEQPPYIRLASTTSSSSVRLSSQLFNKFFGHGTEGLFVVHPNGKMSAVNLKSFHERQLEVEKLRDVQYIGAITICAQNVFLVVCRNGLVVFLSLDPYETIVVKEEFLPNRVRCASTIDSRPDQFLISTFSHAQLVRVSMNTEAEYHLDIQQLPYENIFRFINESDTVIIGLTQDGRRVKIDTDFDESNIPLGRLTSWKLTKLDNLAKKTAEMNEKLDELDSFLPQLGLVAYENSEKDFHECTVCQNQNRLLKCDMKISESRDFAQTAYYLNITLSNTSKVSIQNWRFNLSLIPELNSLPATNATFRVHDLKPDASQHFSIPISENFIDSLPLTVLANFTTDKEFPDTVRSICAKLPSVKFDIINLARIGYPANNAEIMSLDSQLRNLAKMNPESNAAVEKFVTVKTTNKSCDCARFKDKTLLSQIMSSTLNPEHIVGDNVTLTLPSGDMVTLKTSEQDNMISVMGRNPEIVENMVKALRSRTYFVC